ncbi:MAG TPA: glycine zipper domain-containing protein [Burkholderiales bacterium]|nr:glycine zipper domain-containing protein [Burkholderiales bacterium]
MVKSALVVCAVAGALGVAGCSGMSEDLKQNRGQTVGTAGGAVAGGAIGSAVTGGSTLGTLGGAAIGGVAGNQVGKEYDKNHPR